MFGIKKPLAIMIAVCIYIFKFKRRNKNLTHEDVV